MRMLQAAACASSYYPVTMDAAEDEDEAGGWLMLMASRAAAAGPAAMADAAPHPRLLCRRLRQCRAVAEVGCLMPSHAGSTCGTAVKGPRPKPCRYAHKMRAANG